MDFTNTEEQVALRDSVRRFVEREYDWDKRMAAVRSGNGVVDEHWTTMAELGWLGAGLSETDGGFGGSAVENCLLAEEFGAALLTEPFIAHVIATRMLAKIGGPEVGELIESMVAGSLRIVPAFQELAGRGDWMVIETHAHEQDGTVVVSGSKSLVEGAGKADFFLVSANLGNVPALCLVKSGETGLHSMELLYGSWLPVTVPPMPLPQA
jgi:alkylation response protein AidB-like acyl-CoA dehydrogenase